MEGNDDFKLTKEQRQEVEKAEGIIHHHKQYERLVVALWG